MIQNVLRDIGGIGIYGVISVSLFFVVFTSALIWAFRLKKSFLRSMASLPLREDELSAKQESAHSNEPVPPQQVAGDARNAGFSPLLPPPDRGPGITDPAPTPLNPKRRERCAPVRRRINRDKFTDIDPSRN